MRFDLDDKEWAIIEPLLPSDVRGKARVDDRRVLNGMLYVLRTGCLWRDLPERYGPYTTIYNRLIAGQNGAYERRYSKRLRRNRRAVCI